MTTDNRINDTELVAKLREPKWECDGHDTGYETDPLKLKAADRIEFFVMALGTEQTMHQAWRKRAEEVEVEITRLCSALSTANEKNRVGYESIAQMAEKLVQLKQDLLAANSYNAELEAVVDDIINRCREFGVSNLDNPYQFMRDIIERIERSYREAALAGKEVKNDPK